LRSLLVQTAVRIRRMEHSNTIVLQYWSDCIAGRRGNQVAVVALARPLAALLFAMLRPASPTAVTEAEERALGYLGRVLGVENGTSWAALLRELDEPARAATRTAA
jgi:hypothetical protein